VGGGICEGRWVNLIILKIIFIGMVGKADAAVQGWMKREGR
jgi:hypothetical protein